MHVHSRSPAHGRLRPFLLLKRGRTDATAFHIGVEVGRLELYIPIGQCGGGLYRDQARIDFQLSDESDIRAVISSIRGMPALAPILRHFIADAAEAKRMHSERDQP